MDSIFQQFENVCIIDNSFLRTDLSHINKKNYTYIKPCKNIGLGAAYNLAIYSEKKSINKYITFDQDTEIGSNIREVIDSFSCDSLDIHSANWSQSKNVNQSQIQEVPWTISSSMCFSRSLFDLVSGFDENMFIDYVDLDFSLKARIHGSKVYRHNKVVLLHKIGDPISREFFFGYIRFSSSNHSAERRFFMGRNLRLISKRYFFNMPIEILSLYRSKLYMLILIILIEPSKTSKIRSFFSGYFG